MTVDVKYATNKCESLGSENQLILHGNPSTMAKSVSQSCNVIFAECAI